MPFNYPYNACRHSGKSTLEKEEDKSGLTPIHWAIFYNHVEHLKLLLPRSVTASSYKLYKFL